MESLKVEGWLLLTITKTAIPIITISIDIKIPAAMRGAIFHSKVIPNRYIVNPKRISSIATNIS